MRMWMVLPQYLCRQHLLGQHVECHMILGSMRKGKNLSGYKNIIFPKYVYVEHLLVAGEMLRRGYNHRSEIDVGEVDELAKFYFDFPELTDKHISNNKRELSRRCLVCRQKLDKK